MPTDRAALAPTLSVAATFSPLTPVQHTDYTSVPFGAISAPAALGTFGYLNGEIGCHKSNAHARSNFTGRAPGTSLNWRGNATTVPRFSVDGLYWHRGKEGPLRHAD